MKRKYSLAHLTAIGCQPQELIYIAKLAGYDCVGVRPIPMHVPGEVNLDFARDKNLFRLTKQALEDTGIEINDIEVARVYDGVDVKEEYGPAMEAGAELGAKHITASVWTPDREYSIERFAELCELAGQYNLTVNIEFVTWANIRNIRETVELFRKAGKENVGILLDTLHFYRSRDTIAEIMELPARYFNYVHLCDAPAEIPEDAVELAKTGRGERLYVGEGAIDIRSVMDCLPDSVIGLEIPHIQRAAELGYAEHARRCLTTCRNYLGK